MAIPFSGKFHPWRLVAIAMLGVIVATGMSHDIPWWHRFIIYSAVGAFMPSFLER